MEARECLQTRRSVRRYRKEAIPDTVLEDILQSAICAPSAMNMQHWHFVVVRSEEKMQELTQITGNVVAKYAPILEVQFKNHPEIMTETKDFLNSLGGAPVCVLAFLLKDNYPDRDGAIQSVSAAVENLLLAAWDKGIGSCWLTAAQRIGFGPQLQSAFAPDKGEFIAVITLGYSDTAPKMPPRREGRYVFI